MKISHKKSQILKGILFLTVFIMGVLSITESFEIRTEIDNMEIDDLTTLDPEIRKEVEGKILDWGAEFIFGMVMIPLGGLPLLNMYINEKYPQINHNRERTVTYFQTQFGFGLLVIAIMISFSIDSMNDSRADWMYVWGVLSMVGVITLVVYRAKKLHEIFDEKHDLFDF